jgi:hypothetical protein
MALQSSKMILGNILPAMDFILELLEMGKERFKDDEFMSSCIYLAWAKLDKYYNLTSDTPAYAAALFLHPAFKWEYIESTWDADWVLDVKRAVQELWEKDYQPANILGVIAPVAQLSNPSDPNRYSEWKYGKQAIS